MAQTREEKQEEEKRNYIEAIEGFDGTELLFENGFKLTIAVRLTTITADRPHGYSYELNLFAPDANGNAVIRVLGADNAHAPADNKHPHDHWHDPEMNPAKTMPIGVKHPKSIKVESIEALIGKFIEAAAKLLKTLGLGADIASMKSQLQRRQQANEGQQR